jgi:hypothetical protein
LMLHKVNGELVHKQTNFAQPSLSPQHWLYAPIHHWLYAAYVWVNYLFDRWTFALHGY